MIGWLLWIGKPVLLPIIAALIVVYVLSVAADSMTRIPVLRRLPGWARRALILGTFTAAVALLFVFVINNVAQVVTAISRYETNLDALITRLASFFEIEGEQTWENVRRVTFDQVSLRSFVAPALLSLQSFGATLFLVVLYSSFFMAERGILARKLVIAMGGADAGERALSLLNRINHRIGSYLFVKTLVNLMLGAVSFGIMVLLSIEFALVWAILIAILNYIPFLGSLLGVILPVLLSLAQFGSLWITGMVLLSLTAAQVVVGAFLEPRMMGRAFNLSPFVVLLSLAFWSALWGLPGALLAVPMTASLVLVLAEIDATRPIAVMLSSNGQV